MTTWFEIGPGTVRGRKVVECAEVDGVTLRRRVLCLFPLDQPGEIREAARWAIQHDAYWRDSREPVTSVAQVVNTFTALREEN